MSDKKSININKYKKKWNINIGIVLFGAIFIYLLITIAFYLTQKHISVYEVREGTILRDNAYTGLVIREESIVPNDTDGYITYYKIENSKIAVGDNIYTISSDASEDIPVDEAAVVSSGLTREEQQDLILKLQKFNQSFDEQNFNSTYQIKTEIDNIQKGSRNQVKMNQLNQMLADGTTNNIHIAQASDDGIIIYNTDGLEGITVDTFTTEMFDKTKYQRQELLDNQKIAPGNPAYKLITNENWSLIIPLSKEIASELSEKTAVRIRMLKDNEIMWANFNILNRNDEFYGQLSFDNSLIRYATDRFLDIDLIIEDETGLKIPKSAKVTKEFYTIPESYITKGGNGSQTGVLRQSTNKKNDVVTEFLPAEVYYKTEDNICYLDTTIFNENDILIMPESATELSLNESKKLQGVYNINQGYAIFKQINILCESGEYYIVEDGSSYGLSNYDHIVLDGSTVKENEVVFQ